MTFIVRLPGDACYGERCFIAEVLLRDRLGLDLRCEPSEDAGTAIVGEDGARLRMADGFFPEAARHWLEPCTLPARPLRSWPMEPGRLAGMPAGGMLPVLFGQDPATGPMVVRSAKDTWLGLDVFGSAFFMLSRYEEAVAVERDWAERFPSWASLAQMEGFLGRPVVDEYLELLWEELAALWPGLTRRATAYALQLTHDLDWPFATFGVPMVDSLRKMAGDVLVRRCPSLSLRRMRSLMTVGEADYSLDPNNTFEFIMDTSEALGHRSLFNVIAGHTAPGDVDGVYHLDQPWIRHLLRRFRDRGHEVGLHPSFCTFLDPKALGRELANLHRVAEAEGIRQDTWGARQHYLRWQATTTWRIYEEAGLDFDCTLGFADRPGFRCGTCHAYRAYDLQGRHPLRLVERPMIAMDGTIFWKGYLDLALEDAMGTIQPLVNQCRAYGGTFGLLWHNTRLLTPKERQFYKDLVTLAS